MARLKRRSRYRLQMGFSVPLMPSIAARGVIGVIFVYDSEQRQDVMLGFRTACDFCYKTFDGQGFVKFDGGYLSFLDCPFCGCTELVWFDPPLHFRFVPV